MALPDGVLNLQQIVRDLEKRITALETTKYDAPSAADLDAVAEELKAAEDTLSKEAHGGSTAETGSAPEPPAAD